jgi:hypothetical protein
MNTDTTGTVPALLRTEWWPMISFGGLWHACGHEEVCPDWIRLRSGELALGGWEDGNG